MLYNVVPSSLLGMLWGMNLQMAWKITGEQVDYALHRGRT